MTFDENIRHASRLISSASRIWIGAGAGMGVDSGLPDFRGNEGFWNAYPPFRKLGLSFYDLANPRWFRDNPRQAWGFYGHRLNLYRGTAPHAGFDVLLGWVKRFRYNYTVFTSNVDGHFQRSGFNPDRIVECHGSINHLQCSVPCGGSIWPIVDLQIQVDTQTMLADGQLPNCPKCGSVARPNVLMFGDFDWLSSRTDHQLSRYEEWLLIENDDHVVLEFGAGTAVPTVRYEAQRQRGHLIRVNPRESDIAGPGISIQCGALEFIQRVDKLINTS